MTPIILNRVYCVVAFLIGFLERSEQFMNDNTVKATNGTEVYTDDMYRLADEYIDSLPDSNMIFNTVGNCFTGLIKYINRHMGFNNNKSIYDDLYLLNNIWEIYVELVYKYNQKPTIEEYALLIGISRETLYSWMNGVTRTDDYSEKLGSSRSDTIKKWQNECRIGRYKSAASGNVGGIFLCKAVDGMVETAPVQIVNQEQRKSIEQIAQEHQVKAIESADTSVIEQPKADF
jgi:hypothetical protein